MEYKRAEMDADLRETITFQRQAGAMQIDRRRARQNT
jgi:hypothetical protein